MNTKYLTTNFMIAITSSIILLGCSNATTTLTASPTLTELTSSPNPTLTLITTATQTATSVPSPTPASVPPSPTPTITPTLLPTLTTEERLNYTQELFRTNANCKLHCWWGITPGASTWFEVETFLQFIGARTSPQILHDGSVYHSAGGFDLVLPESTITNRFGFLEREGFIELISIRSEGYSNPAAFQEQWALFSPKQVFEDYGVPSRVWLESRSGGPIDEGRIAGYTLWVFYDHLGFLILYNGYAEYEPIYHFCPRFENGKDIRFIHMYLQSPENPGSVEETAGIIGLEIEPFPNVQSIEEAAGISTTDFYNLFIQEDEVACFDTPRDIWP